MMNEKPIDSGSVQYIGGHKAYPKPLRTEIFFYDDRFEIADYDIKVYYNKIKNISNSSERKRHEDWFAFGLIGYALWKKNAIYTLIEYDDGADIQKMVLDFENNAKYAQGLIYKKMLEYRMDKEETKDKDKSS